MKARTRVESDRKADHQLMPQADHPARAGRVPELLALMDVYDWASVDDIAVDQDERRESSRRFQRVLDDSGLRLNGSVLDLACGTNTVAYSHPDTVAVDNDPQKIKRLRKDGIRAILADIEDLPFEDKSFDYVVSFSPPLQPVIHHKGSYISFGVDREWSKKIVEAALKIARREVLIASHFVALHPPYEDRVEKRDDKDFQWVLYRAGDDPLP